MRYDEAAARELLLVQACDQGPADNPIWTPDDGRWATELARRTVAADATDARFLAERAHHALQRLLPRDRGLARALARRAWRTGWLALAIGLGLATGIAADAVGAGDRINLLAPPLWGVLLWNGLVYIGLLLPLGRWSHGPRAALARRIARAGGGRGVLPAFHAAWARVAAPLALARASLLLHGAAAALGVGLIASLYLRGLVLDYRVVWQSTFLDAAQVHAVLTTLFTPASALTGVAIPDVAALQALRVGPQGAAAAAAVPGAAPWLHLCAATVLLAVVLPRLLLAVAAAARSRWLAGRCRIAIDEPYFQRLLRAWRRSRACVQVLPHGAAPPLQAAAALQRLLAPVLGDDLHLTFDPAVAHGAEDQVAPREPATTLRLLLVDLAATPEDEAQGRIVAALRSTPALCLADEGPLRLRYGALPQRLAERRAAWQRWCEAQGLPFVAVDLLHGTPAAAEPALQAALAKL
ncbi:MAG: DUF2868 domain-containing protein [Burkholderiales bacterium]|nr:DUF2868 domain-containing protein [Burkholderiales bacterium]